MARGQAEAMGPPLMPIRLSNSTCHRIRCFISDAFCTFDHGPTRRLPDGNGFVTGRCYGVCCAFDDAICSPLLRCCRRCRFGCILECRSLPGLALSINGHHVLPFLQPLRPCCRLRPFPMRASPCPQSCSISTKYVPFAAKSERSSITTRSQI